MYNKSMLTLNTIMIGTMQISTMAAFYEKLFSRPADHIEGGWYGWKTGSNFFTIGEHSEMGGNSKDPGRIMLNFETKEVKEEFDRIKGFGATAVKEPYEMGGGWIATLADPDGNYFQLVTPWE